MSLKDLVAQTATVSVPSAGGPVPLVVRGLGLGAIMALMRNYGDTLESLYTKAAAGEMEADMLGGLISEAMARSGDLVADIIAWGCGEPDQADQCKLIPVGAQVELLEAILLLTFAAEGGPKKLMETVIRAMSGFNSLDLGG